MFTPLYFSVLVIYGAYDSRDEKKMAEIKAGVDKFNDELLTLMEKLRG